MRRNVTALKISKCGGRQPRLQCLQVMPNEILSPHQKALRINLDRETLRHLCRNRRRPGSRALVFPRRRRVGHSRQNYFRLRHGRERRDLRPAPRYVSRQRLRAMLDYEYDLLLGTAWPKRGEHDALFCFCGYGCHAAAFKRHDDGTWLARHPFSNRTATAPSRRSSFTCGLLGQGERAGAGSAGIIGINLIYGAFYLRDDAGEVHPFAARQSRPGNESKWT